MLKELPKADLLITKDTIIHIPNWAILKFLETNVNVCPPRYKEILFIHDRPPYWKFRWGAVPLVRHIVRTGNWDCPGFSDFHEIDLRVAPYHLDVVNLFEFNSSTRADRDQLHSFRTEEAKCLCCSLGHDDDQARLCDRRVVLDCADCIRTWFGSVASFEATVQSIVFAALSRRLGALPFTYRWLILAAAPVVWGHFDLTAGRLRSGDYYWASIVGIIGLSWWLAAGPTLFILPAMITGGLLRTGSLLSWRDICITVCGSSLVVMVAVAVVGYQYVCVQLFPSPLAGALCFAVTMLIFSLCVWSPESLVVLASK
eukprot:s3045_g1.t1